MGRIPRGMKLLFVLASLLSAAAWVVVAQTAKVVDDNALRDAGKNKEEWISYNRDWAETRFSPLDQINAANVKTLGLAWSYDIPNVGAGNRQEGTPLVSNGVLYSITPWSLVYAVNARTGKEIWQSDPQANRSASTCCGVVNRGLALYQGKVIAPVIDGRLRALDEKTGALVWETRVTPTNLPYTITMAPRVIKGGRVIIGASGGEYSVRGLFAAFDATTGKELWKFYTVPGDPSKPFEQPILADWAKTWDAEKKWWVAGGGGPVWGSIAYDVDTDLVYVGTGQPGPWSEVGRGKGDNLCTNCIIAVKGETGKYVWHYQTTPGDDWDYDSIADIQLADLTINGRARKVLMHAPKNGFVFVIDRVNGEFISAEPWVQVNWASGIDPKTGKAIVNPAARYGTTTVNVTPGPGGGHVWPPSSFNPMTGLLYIPSQNGARGYNFSADPNFVITSAEIEPGARGRMQMGTGGGGGGGGGRGGGGGAAGGRGGAPGGGLAPGLDPNAPGLPPAGGAGAAPAPGGARGALAPAVLYGDSPATPVSIAAVQAPGGGQGGGGAAGGGRGGGRGAGGGAPGGGGGAPGGGGGAQGGAPGLPLIGPVGNGSMIVAWNPATQKEAWRGPSGSAAGFNAGGSLTTAGNLVFTHVNTTLYAFNAATGEVLLNLTTGLNGGPGPPMTFMLDGVQYISIAGVIGGGGGGAGGGGGGGGGRGGGAAGAAAPGGGAPGGAGAAAPGGAGGGRGGGAGGAGGGRGGGGRRGAGGGGGRGGGAGARLEDTRANVVNAAFVQAPPAGGAAGGGGRGGGGGGGRGGGGAAAGPQAPQSRLLILKLNGTPLAAGAAPAAPGGN